MKRWVFNVAALLSALLFAWACWAWVRSYQPRHVELEAADGRIFLMFWEHPGRPLTEGFEPGGAFADRASLLWASLIRRARGGAWEWLGFGFVEGRTASIPTIRMVSVPLWFIVMMTAVIPVAWAVHTLRQRRRALENRCMNCGYDLRASGERCPECGTAVGATKSAAAGDDTPITGGTPVPPHEHARVRRGSGG